MSVAHARRGIGNFGHTSEIGAHVWGGIGNLFYLRHLFQSAVNLKFISK